MESHANKGKERSLTSCRWRLFFSYSCETCWSNVKQVWEVASQNTQGLPNEPSSRAKPDELARKTTRTRTSRSEARSCQSFLAGDASVLVAMKQTERCVGISLAKRIDAQAVVRHWIIGADEMEKTHTKRAGQVCASSWDKNSTPG